MAYRSIVIACSEFPPMPGGIGNHAFNMARQLSEGNRHVEVITNQRLGFNEEKEFLESRIPKASVYLIKRRKPAFLTYFKRRKQLKRRLNALSGDTALWVSGSFWIMCAGSIKIPKNVDLYAVIHGTEIHGNRRLLERGLRKCKKLVCVSSYTRKKFHEAFPELKTKTEVINNGFDLDLPLDKKLTRQKPPSGKPLKLLTIGNVHPRKGQDNVIRLLPDVLKIYPELEYHVVGIASHTVGFKKLAQDLGVSDHVIFHGRLDEKELIDQLSASDIFVMLSKELDNGDFEGFGIAILEANSFGLPAIGSKDSGIEDAIHQDVNGRVIAYNDAEGFVTAIQQIMLNYGEFSQRAVAWAAQFHWTKVIDRYNQVMND